MALTSLAYFQTASFTGDPAVFKTPPKALGEGYHLIEIPHGDYAKEEAVMWVMMVMTMMFSSEQVNLRRLCCIPPNDEVLLFTEYENIKYVYIPRYHGVDDICTIDAAVCTVWRCMMEVVYNLWLNMYRIY